MKKRELDRRDFLKGASGAAAGLALPGSFFQGGEKKATRPPNVVILFADQWRFSAFGHGSDPMVRTPNFDRLAKEGALCKRTYSAYPLCTPNRSALMTSRFPHQTGMIQNNLMLPPSEKGFAEIFRDAGYQTLYIGKWHMDGAAKPGFVPPGWRRRGFEKFIGFNRGHLYYRSKTFSNDGKLMHPKGFEPTFQTNLAIDFMKENKDRPFLCFLSWGPPHTPYKPPKGFRRFFGMEKLEFRPNVPEKLRGTKRLRRFYAGYFGLCEALDHEAGRVLAALKELGLEKNTVVLFTSDHGDMLGSHRRFFKNDPHEESLHVPLLVRAPGIVPAGLQVEELVSTIDIAPTLLGLCGLKPLPRAEGLDLSPLLKGGKGPEREFVYAEGRMAVGPGKRRNATWRALVTKEHKLVLGPKGEVDGLFDLAGDPLEMKNLAGEKSKAALKKDLLAKARAYAKKTGDSFPGPPGRVAKRMYAKGKKA